MDDRTESVAAQGRTETVDAAADEAEAKTREIRREISHTQRDLAETIGAIQEKLTPSNIVSDARERIKEATTERVRHMANSAGRTAGQVVEAGRQNNWVPAALIGVGAAWLLANQRWGRESRDYDESEQGAGYGDGYYPVSGRRGQPGYGESRGFMSYGREEESESLRDRANELSERAGEMADRARTTMRQTTVRAQSQLQRLMRENPLMIGAAAVVAGAAIGMALPETERENEWMGETSEQVADRAQEMAKNAVDTVKEKAKDAAAQAVDTITGAGTD